MDHLLGVYVYVTDADVADVHECPAAADAGARDESDIGQYPGWTPAEPGVCQGRCPAEQGHLCKSGKPRHQRPTNSILCTIFDNCHNGRTRVSAPLLPPFGDIPLDCPDTLSLGVLDLSSTGLGKRRRDRIGVE